MKNNNNLDILNFRMPRWEELPSIDLYMDQVLNYLYDCLGSYIKDENLITKTMINNYVKNDVIDSPVKKKYNRLAISELFIICILKQVYSINEIKSLIELALSSSSADVSYNKFCDILEDSLKCTFNKTETIQNEKLTEQQYLLKNVVQSIVNKLYVQVTFLKNDTKN